MVMSETFLFQDEKQRIEDLGGCITFMGCWRVNGTYAVSRAIGKHDLRMSANTNRLSVWLILLPCVTVNCHYLNCYV